MTNIRVALRVRPLSQREVDGNYPVVVAVENNSAFITDIRVPERPSADSRQRFRKFDFDHTFWFSTSTGRGRSSATQHEIYKEMGPHLVKAILSGYNACLLAYGMSGSGKTHTMIGTREDPGIIPRLCHSLWEKLKTAHPPLANGQPSFRMEVSFLEIYREKVRDLLNPEKSLKLREHPQLGPHVQGLTRLEVTGELSLLDLLWEGERRRATGNTNSNRRSSRSHAIWTLYMTVHNGKEKENDNRNSCGGGGDRNKRMSMSSTGSSSRSSLDRSGSSAGTCSGINGNGATSPLSSSPTSKGRIITNQVHLVDLAGSEKADCTTAKSLLAEGADINRSLVALGNVISALAEKAQYVPYRDSALTWLLRDSIGGNASTSIIITASPSSHCHAQTLNSLRFAQRARLVENTPKINLASTSYLEGGVASPYGYLSVMSAMELKKDIGRLAKIIKTAQNNGGILRGLAPRANWTRLIHAIEGIGQAEQEQVKLQRERACSEDATANTTRGAGASLASPSPSTSSLSTPPSSCTQDGGNSSTSSPTTPTTPKTKSLNDVMVQADRDLELSKRRHPLLNHLRRRNSRQQSESALNTSALSQSTPHDHTTSSTPTHSPTKIVGTEVFIPTSNSYKCLTWQQEETQIVPKPISSSSQSSLLSEENADDDDTSTTLTTSSNPQINHLKYLLEIRYPVTHNLDHASRISERIHGNINDEHYQLKTKLVPTSVNMDPNLASKEAPTVQDIIPTLVNPQSVKDPEEIYNKAVRHVDPTNVRKNAVVVCHQAQERKDYLFPSKCTHFATAQNPKALPLTPFVSSDEYEFDDPDAMDLNSLPVYRAVHPEICQSLQRKFSRENEDICCLSAVESTLSQVPTMIISTSCEDDDEDGVSSSSYEDINMPTVVRPVNLIREFSKLSDPDCEEILQELLGVCDDEGSDNVFSEEKADVSLVANEPMDTADTIEILVEENPDTFFSDNLFINRESVINGVSDCKFRNYFAKELHQMERMGKQIKSLLQLTQRYNVAKPYLDEITNLQNADHSKEDPEMDKCIERCSGWNVEVELKKVEKEISQLNKVLRTGIGQGGGEGVANQLYHPSTSSTSTINAHESDSSEMEGLYANTVGFAQKRNIPLLSGSLSGLKVRNQRPPLPIPSKGSVSQPCMSSSSSNNASFVEGRDISLNSGKFTPNFYSTPMKTTTRTCDWSLGVGPISEDEVFEKPSQVGEGVTSFKPHPAPTSLLNQTQSLQSMQTFYRNPVVNGNISAGNLGGGSGRGLEYCASSENVSVTSSNMTSASAYHAHHGHHHRNDNSSSGGGIYPLNISYSETPRRYFGNEGTHERSYSKGISGSSVSFQPHRHLNYNNFQNSFNLEEIRNHGRLYDSLGGVSGDTAETRFSLDSNPLNRSSSGHVRSASDSLDLCSCGDTGSKYSLARGSCLPLEKSSSRSQFSSFGGSSLTTTTDALNEYSLSQFTFNTSPPSTSAAFYTSRPQHQHSKSVSSSAVTGIGENLMSKGGGYISSGSSHDYHNHYHSPHHIFPHLYKLPKTSAASRLTEKF